MKQDCERLLFPLAAALALLAGTTQAQAPCVGVSELARGAPLRAITGIVEAVPDKSLVLSVLDGTGQATGELLELDLGSGAVTGFASGLPIGTPGKLVLGDGGPLVGTDVVLADWNSALTAACCTGAILSFDGNGVSTGAVSTANPYFGGPNDPACLALSPGGAWIDDALYVGDFEGASANLPNIYRVLPDGSLEGVFMDPAVWTASHLVTDIEFDPWGGYGGDLFVLDPSGVSGGVIWRIDPAGVIDVLASDNLLSSVVDIAFGQGGTAWGEDLYALRVTSTSAELLGIDPGGAVTVLHALPAPTGPLAGITVGQGGGLVFSSLGDPIVAYGDAVYRLRTSATVDAYCSPGVSASGCTALLHASGTASASAPSGFVLSATGVEGSKDGIFFFGTNGRQVVPWGNGTSFQCVRPPVRRAGLLASAGTTGACDGAFAQDLNALWCPSCPKPSANPGPGAVVQAQLWYRDPLSTSNQTTSLSDAVEFVLCP